MKGKKKSKRLSVKSLAAAMPQPWKPPTPAERTLNSAKDLIRSAAEEHAEKSGAAQRLANVARKIVRRAKAGAEAQES